MFKFSEDRNFAARTYCCGFHASAWRLFNKINYKLGP